MLVIGWQLRYTDNNGMLEALKATAAWYDQNRDWWQADKQSDEATYAKQGQ